MTENAHDISNNNAAARHGRRSCSITLLAVLQFAFGLFLVTLRFLDLPERRIPFVLLGVPFLFLFWGLLQRRRWAPWLGLAHSLLFPVIWAVGTRLTPAPLQRHTVMWALFPPFPDIAVMLGYAVLGPLNLIASIILLASAERHRPFDVQRPGRRLQWSTRRMQFIWLLLPVVICADYFVPLHRHLRRTKEHLQQRQEYEDLVRQFVDAAERADADAVAECRQALVAHYYRGPDVIAHLSHPDENVRLEVVALIRELRLGSFHAKTLWSHLDDPTQPPAVHAALLDLLVEWLIESTHPSADEMQQALTLDDPSRALLCIHSNLWDWNENDGRKVPLRHLKALLLASDPEGSQVTRQLADKLDEDNWRRQRDALRALILLGEVALPIKEEVRLCLSHEQRPLIQVYAAAMLVGLKDDDQRLVTTLQRGVNYERHMVAGPSFQGRKLAIEALGKLGPRAAAAIPVLTQASLDPTPEIALAAQEALKQVATQE